MENAAEYMKANTPNMIGIIHVIIFCVAAACPFSPSTVESCICVFCVLFMISVEPSMVRIDKAISTK